MSEREVNFDGLVGPTHVFAGLATGNMAAAENAERVSNPRLAALQGLTKMRLLVELGLPQGVLPPQERPHLGTIRRLGFEGGDSEVIARVAAEAPGLLRAVCSASSMWVANAATVSAGADTADGRVHFTPANLVAHLHRSIEAEATAKALAVTFPGDQHFVHHRALPAQMDLGDEGAANHTRLVTTEPGSVQLFVYGRSSERPHERAPKRYMARQTLEASRAVARQHGLDPAKTLFLQQNPDAIDRGVFHNDVIAVGHGKVLLYHEEAFSDPGAVDAMRSRLGDEFMAIMVPSAAVTVEDAVRSYLFNSQLVTRPDGSLLLLGPAEILENAAVAGYVADGLISPQSPIVEVLTIDLRESMRNGGGPACLRLRVPLDDTQLGAVNGASLLDLDRIDVLEDWVNRHYRDELRMSDLADPHLLGESRSALDELTQILELGSLYDFQNV